jgi:hypothetical protein
VAIQLNVIRGDRLCDQTINLSSNIYDDFDSLVCTGHIRPHPDGSLLYQFIPTLISGTSGSATVTFNIPGSVTTSFPPINLYGDIEFYSNDLLERTLFQFRLNVSPDVTHI